MKQPEVGKKIAALRSQKGLTQAELAQLCNVSARTIQRIENADVEPQSFTVRTIFASLGHEAYATSNEPERRSRFPEKLVDLFNLKTNTMKKLMILSSPMVLAFGLSMLFGANVSAQDKTEKAIEEANSSFKIAFNEGKVEKAVAIYSTDACSTPGPTSEICGKENIKNYFSVLYEQGFRYETLESKSVKITGNVAIDKGIWVAKTSGQKLSGTYLTQWKFVDGKWKIENETSTVGVQ